MKLVDYSEIRLLFGLALLLLATSSICYANGDESVGTITCIKGEVTIVSKDGTEREAKVGDKVKATDTIKTGKRARTQIVFVDDTTLSIGRKTEMKCGHHTKKDSHDQNHIINLLNGAFQCVGGAIKKMGEDRIHNVTPTIAVGIRGTEFWMSEDPILGLTELSVIDGSVVVDGIDWPTLPDSYFIDPLSKSIDTLDLDAIMLDVDETHELVDLLGIGSPVIVDAGYWVEIEAGHAPPMPLMGLAPSHQDCECCIPEPATILLLGLGAVMLRRVG